MHAEPTRSFACFACFAHAAPHLRIVCRTHAAQHLPFHLPVLRCPCTHPPALSSPLLPCHQLSTPCRLPPQKPPVPIGHATGAASLPHIRRRTRTCIIKQPPSQAASFSLALHVCPKWPRRAVKRLCHCQGFRVLILYIDGGPSPVLCCSASRPATAHAHDTTESTEDEPMSVSRLQKCAAAACHQNVKCFHRLTPSAVHFAKAFTLRAGTPRSKSSAAARSALYT